MKTVILDDWERATDAIPLMERLRQFSEVQVYHDQPTEAQVIERVREADAVIFMRERTRVTKALLDQMARIQLIAQTGTGLAHLDMAEVNRRKIPVAITPGGSTAAVTELTFGLLLAVSRNLVHLTHQLQQGAWPLVSGHNLAGKTLGLIGLGKIGCSVARVAQAFGMQVVAWGPRLTAERAEAQGVAYVSLPELLAQSHYVSLHVRLVPETRNVIGREQLAQMRSDAVLINTSRGELIDEHALVEALQNQQIRGAGLDVFVQEPLPADHPLLQRNNVVLSPHIGWKTDNTFASFLNGSIENIEHFFVHGTPHNIANPDVLY